MATRFKENQFKGLAFAVLFTALMLQTLLSLGQSFKGDTYKGLTVSFHTRSLGLASSIKAIDQAQLTQAGGQIGVVYGNSLVRANLGLLGYYSSVGNTQGTTDLYESGLGFNFYPLALVTDNLPANPYLTGAVAYDRYKFYGHYLNEEAEQINYSQGEAPYLGKVKQVNTNFGIGIEVRLKDDYDFVHLFAEARYGHNLLTRTDEPAFAGTRIDKQTQILIGISFGAHR